MSAARPDGGARAHHESPPVPRRYENTLAARKFLGRLAQLDLEGLGTAIRRWHNLVGEQWFEAEAALSHAVHDDHGHAEQETWLEEIAGIFLRKPWFTRQNPGAQIGASDASGQYVATIAMLALLARSELQSDAFEQLYEPFSELIPLEELDRE